MGQRRGNFSTYEGRPLTDAVAAFIQDASFKPSARTLQFYEDQVGRAFLNAMVERNVKTLEEVTPEVIRDWLVGEMTATYVIGGHVRPLSRTTVNLRQSAARRFLAWCVQQEWIPTSPMTRVQNIKRAQGVRVGYSKEEVARLYRVSAESASPFIAARDRAIVSLLVGTGCRAGGLLNMTMASLDLVRHRLTLTEKGQKTRMVLLGKKTEAALAAYIRVRPASRKSGMFWLDVRQKTLTYWALNDMLKRLGTYCEPNVTPCIPHRFRHTFAAEHYTHNRDIMALMSALGHSKVETTQMYLRTLGVEYHMVANYPSPDEWLT